MRILRLACRQEKRRAHAVLSLQLYSFLLLLLCAGTGVEALFGGPTAMPALVDPFVSITLLAACAAYLYAAVGAVTRRAGCAGCSKSRR